jgi:hypothetical protein
MIQNFFNIATLHSNNEQELTLLPSKIHQQYFIRLFERKEWRNSTIRDIHHQLIEKLQYACQITNQLSNVKEISLKMLQLELRPDTWKKLQFDHITMFSNMNW